MELMPMVDNVLAAFVKSSDDEIHDGITWYDRARELAMRLDPDNPARAAGIIAAMSPLTSWPQNVRHAERVYATGTTQGMGNNVRKAERIFNGENPLDVLSGDKVTSFFHNIMGDGEGVTVDRHAIDVAYGKVQNDAERSAAVKRTKARDGYGLIRQAYIHASAILTNEGNLITPAELQAIVWVYWRNNVIRANHGDAVMV